MDVDDIRLPPGIVMPDILEQRLSADGFIRMAHEIFEQFEFAWQQFDRLAAQSQSMFDEIQLERTKGKTRDSRIAPTAKQNLDPSDEFAHREWLYEIVVASGAKTADPFVD